MTWEASVIGKILPGVYFGDVEGKHDLTGSWHLYRALFSSYLHFWV